MTTYTFSTLDDPLGINMGAQQHYATVAQGINDQGQIVGYYYDSGGNQHGFLYSGGTYTTLDDPLATGTTLPYSINDPDQIVGFYSGIGTFPLHGFLYSGGTFTTLNDPLGTNGSFAFGIAYRQPRKHATVRPEL
jgi:probable HAF family extracellular repeat protein